MGLLNAPLFLMNNLKIEKPKERWNTRPFWKWVSVWKGKTYTGRSPQNCVKKKGEPPKNTNIIYDQIFLKKCAPAARQLTNNTVYVVQNTVIKNTALSITQVIYIDLCFYYFYYFDFDGGTLQLFY